MSELHQSIKSSVSLTDVICRETSFQMKGKHLSECPFCCGHGCFSIKGDQFKCFQCPEHGDLFDFLKKHKALDDRQVLEYAVSIYAPTFSEKLQQVYPKKSPPRMTPAEKIFMEAAAYYHKNAMENGAHAYLIEKRCHDPETLRRLQVGWSDGKLYEYLKSAGFSYDQMVDSGLVSAKNDGSGFYDLFNPGRAIFPHFLHGKVVHFTQKDPEKEDKWQLPAEKRSKNWRFYNQDAISKFEELILVEGENDLASVIDAGSANVFAMIGQISDEQIRALENMCRTKKLLIWMDNDNDPIKLMAKGKGYVRKICAAMPNHDIKVLVYPEQFKDPDEFLVAIPEIQKKKAAIRELKQSAVDYLSWEILQAAALESIEKKLKHLEDLNIFARIALLPEIKQSVYIDKLKHLGFTEKGIVDKLEADLEIKKKISIYLSSLTKKEDADPIYISDMLFQYFKSTGRFFRTSKEEVYLLYKNKIYSLSTNVPFNALMMRTAGLLPTLNPGRSVWVALSNLGYTHGVEIKSATWLFTDPNTDSIYINLNLPGNMILKISRSGIEEVPNGINNSNVLLKNSGNTDTFTYDPDVDVAEGFKYLKELVFNNLACEIEQRYMILCWMISAFLFDFSTSQFIMKFSGLAAGGKTTAAKLLSLLIYGTEDVGSQTASSAFSESSQNPIIVLDNLEQENINTSMRQFLLLSASKASKTKRSSGTDSDTVKERPKSLVLTTAIEPFSLSEMISRMCEIEFNKLKHGNEGYIEGETFNKIKKYRNLMLSGIFKVISSSVLHHLEDRKDYLTILKKEHQGHSMERNDEYLSLLFVILNKIIKYMPFYTPKDVQYGLETGEVDIRKRWIDYQNKRSREMQSGSNNIIKMLDGIVREYVYEMAEKKIQAFNKLGYDFPVFEYQHPDYGLTLIKTTPELKQDQENQETYRYVEIDFIATAADIVYAFDVFCRRHGLRNPYSSAAVFGRRLENDESVLNKNNWYLEKGAGIEPHFKIIHGKRFFKLKHALISNY